MSISLQSDEKIIDTWTLNYLPPNGGKYLGKLTVTNQNLYYEAKFDTSFSGMVKEMSGIYLKDGELLSIERSSIDRVDSQKSFFKKKVIITLKDGSQHIFDYGMMGIDKLLEALS